jgi:hypothetical protein
VAFAGCDADGGCVLTAEQLVQAAKDCRSVTGFHTHREIPMPAAFIASMQFRMVMNILPRLKLYTPAGKRKHPVSGEGLNHAARKVVAGKPLTDKERDEVQAIAKGNS